MGCWRTLSVYHSWEENEESDTLEPMNPWWAPRQQAKDRRKSPRQPSKEVVRFKLYTVTFGGFKVWDASGRAKATAVVEVEAWG